MKKTLFATFWIGNDELAVSTESFREVINFPENVMVMPLYPEVVSGVFNLRGVVIPLVNMGQILKLSTQSGFSQVAIVEFEEGLMGIAISSVGKVYAPSAQDVELFSHPQHSLGFIKIPKEDKLIQILNPAKCLPWSITATLKTGMLKAKKNQNFIKGISFRVEENQFIFPMNEVKEIVEVKSIEPATFEFPFYLGRMILREQSVPVIDFSKLLKLTSSVAPTERTRALIVEQAGQRIALLVNEIENIEKYETQDIMPVPQLAEGCKDIFSSMLSLNEKEFLLGNPRQLLMQPEIQELFKVFKAFFNNQEMKEKKVVHNRKTYVTFGMDRKYALEMKSIKEIIQYPAKISQTNSVSENLRGMFLLRGDLIPVVNSDKLLKLSENTVAKKFLIICEVNQNKVAFEVSSVQDILTFGDEEQHDLPPVLYKKSGDSTAHITRAVRVSRVNGEPELDLFLFELKVLNNLPESVSTSPEIKAA